MIFGCILMCLGEKLERGEIESTQKLPKIFFFFYKMRGLGVFTKENWTFSFWGTLYGRRPPLLTSAILAFTGLDLDTYLKVFPNSNWADLSVPRKLWMPSFQNTEEIENQWWNKKLWP